MEISDARNDDVGPTSKRRAEKGKDQLADKILDVLNYISIAAYQRRSFDRGNRRRKMYRKYTFWALKKIAIVNNNNNNIVLKTGFGTICHGTKNGALTLGGPCRRARLDREGAIVIQQQEITRISSTPEDFQPSLCGPCSSFSLNFRPHFWCESSDTLRRTRRTT